MSAGELAVVDLQTSGEQLIARAARELDADHAVVVVRVQ